MNRPTEFVFDSTQHQPIDPMTPATSSGSIQEAVRVLRTLTPGQRAGLFLRIAREGMTVAPLSAFSESTPRYTMRFVASEWPADDNELVDDMMIFDSADDIELDGAHRHLYVLVPVQNYDPDGDEDED